MTRDHDEARDHDRARRKPEAPAFQDKVALVTGASSGIGAATARTLAARGASVAVNYHRGESRAARIVESLRDDGARAMAVGGDVTDAEQVRSMVERTEAALGPIDVLVLNATGLYGHDVTAVPFTETTPQYVEWTVQRQLSALLQPIDAALPGMLARGRGSIVAVGSALSHSPAPRFLALAAAKAAVEAVVKTLAQEVGPRGVRVNAVGPGLILSESTARMPEPARRAKAEAAAIRRNGLPQDVAETIAFLASDQAGYLTGGYVLVDGGTAML